MNKPEPKVSPLYKTIIENKYVVGFEKPKSVTATVKSKPLIKQFVNKTITFELLLKIIK